MKNKVTLSVAQRNELLKNTIGPMELDQAILDSVSGGDGKVACSPIINWQD